MTENHFVKVCRSPKDKFKFEFEKKQTKKTTTSALPHGAQTLFTSSLKEMVCLQRILMMTMTTGSTRSQPLLFMTTWRTTSTSPGSQFLLARKEYKGVNASGLCSALQQLAIISFQEDIVSGSAKAFPCQDIPYYREAILPLGKVSLVCGGV